MYDYSKASFIPEELNNLADFTNETMGDLNTFLIKNKPEFFIDSYDKSLGLPISYKQGVKPIAPIRPNTS